MLLFLLINSRLNTQIFIHILSQFVLMGNRFIDFLLLATENIFYSILMNNKSLFRLRNTPNIQRIMSLAKYMNHVGINGIDSKISISFHSPVQTSTYFYYCKNLFFFAMIIIYCQIVICRKKTDFMHSLNQKFESVE